MAGTSSCLAQMVDDVRPVLGVPIELALFVLAAPGPSYSLLFGLALRPNRDEEAQGLEMAGLSRSLQGSRGEAVEGALGEEEAEERGWTRGGDEREEVLTSVRRG